MAKTIRSYYSLVRAKQADETRTRIATAARRLILGRGFVATTIGAIAREAGVAEPTVYAIFGSKRRILIELIDRARFGPGFQQLKEEAEGTTDGVERLRLTARIVRQVYDGERSEMELLRRARSLLPEIAERYEEMECGRYDALCTTVEMLVRAGRLRADLTPQEARDILFTFTSREIYRLMVVERGWSSERFERWLSRTFEAQIVAPPPPVHAPRTGRAKRELAAAR